MGGERGGNGGGRGGEGGGPRETWARGEMRARGWRRRFCCNIDGLGGWKGGVGPRVGGGERHPPKKIGVVALALKTFGNMDSCFPGKWMA